MTRSDYAEMERKVLRYGRIKQKKRSGKRRQADDEMIRSAKEWLKYRRTQTQNPKWCPPSP